MKLIIVRHGETEENKKRIIQGHLPGTLSGLGREQAKRLAERLKQEKIDYIFSSDLTRAADTAKEIAKYYPNVPFEFREDLRERNWGDFQGVNKENIPNWKKLEFDVGNLGKNVETFKELFERARNIINYIQTNYSNKNILLVTHWYFIHFLIGLLLKEKLNEINVKDHEENTAVTIFELDKDGKLYMKVHNCTKHLKE